MKKNTMMRIASVLLVAVILSTCAISGTFAKYTSSKDFTSTANIAKWSFKVGEEDIATATTALTFNLFDKAYELDSTNGTVTTTEDAEVKSGKIAPGTGGTVTLNITNASEVKAKFTATFTETTNASNVPILYCLTNSETASDWKELSELTFASEQPIGMTESDNTASITLYWKWAFESNNDTLDTTAGVAAGTVVVTANISATQVD